MRYLILLICLWTAPAIAWERACIGATPCELENGGRSYHVLPPDDWDGTTALPVLLHFHGWARQGSLIVKHGRIASATRKRGVLLVAPNGNGGSWNFWRSGTEDVPFATAVIEDIARTYPIDRDRIYVSGYSYGSAMAWRYVCQNGENVAALLAISGTLDQTEACVQGPREVRHVHGLNDTVMDFPFGTDGAIDGPVMLWRNQFGCEAARDLGPWNAREFLTFQRTIWDDCVAGRRVILDVHPGGHFIPHGWIARQLDQMLGLPATYP